MQCACKRTPFQGTCKTYFRLLKPAKSSYRGTRCRTPRRFDAQQLHLSARKSPGQVGCQSSTVSSGSTSQTSSADPDQPTTTTASTSDTLTTSEAVYVKGPVAPGTVLDYPDKSVVILGDIPVTSRVRAGGDVIVMGTLSGDVEAGCEGDESSLILISKISPSASLSIAGRITAAAAAHVGRDTNLMLLLQPGETAPAFQAMPGTPPLKAAATEVSVLPKLARAAGALAVLSLGLALVVAPGAVLGNLLSVGAESVAGALLDVFVFGYILLKGAGLLSEGSELLLEVLNPGIIGGVVLPVLGALPDSLIILTSLSAAQAEAQEQVAVGIGTLAGSTVLLLSLAWGVSVLLGRCDLSPLGVAVDKKHTRGWDLFNTGVTVDRDVRQGAQIMGVSVLLYGIVQVPAFLGFSKSPQAALTGAAVCLVGMVAYCCYSVMYPQLQQRRIDAARKKRFRMVAVKSLALQSSERYQSSLVDPYGRPVPSMVRQIFDDFDVDRNGYIDADELPALLTTLKYASGGGTVDDEGVKYLLKEFDTNSDAQISYDEFQTALSRWVGEKLSSTAAAGGGGMQGFQRRYEQLMDPRSGGAAAAVLADLPEEDLEQLQETAVGLDQESPEEAAEDLDEQQQPLTTADIWRKSVLCMAAGVALCAVFSDPLVEALTNLSRATGIPPFVVGFVLTPLASNSSEFVSSLTFAARKRRKNMSLTLSQVYGAVTLNNTLVLGLFLLVVYLRRLEWVYSSEVTVIVASTLAVAFLGYSRSTFRAIWAVPVIALYPLSLLGVYALDTFLGWQ